VNPKTAWIIDKRPIYSRLPQISQRYKAENPANPGNWITQWFDELLVKTKASIDDLPRQLNALTCDADWIDFVAYLSGFSGEYWDKAWSMATKRAIASKANWIWSNKGTQEVLEYIIAAVGLSAVIWLADDGTFDVDNLDEISFGEPQYQYFIQVPFSYDRDGMSFRLAEKINRLYGPIVCDSAVCYDGIYLDYSEFGDAFFD
jgi:phage tail P2-like protein